MVERFDLDFHGCHGQDAFIGPDDEGGYVSYADYARLEEALRDKESLEHALEFVSRMCWRTDPPNANAPFTDQQRFEAIKYHPTIKKYGQPHIELAEKEAQG